MNEFGKMGVLPYVRNLIVAENVAIKLCDGVTIYADLIRPKDNLNDLPTIISWCFYGKPPGDSPKEWQIFGVPPETCPKMTKFEGWILNTGAIRDMRY